MVQWLPMSPICSILLPLMTHAKYGRLEFQGATHPNSSSSRGGLVASLPNMALCPWVGGFAPLLTLPMST